MFGKRNVFRVGGSRRTPSTIIGRIAVRQTAERMAGPAEAGGLRRRPLRQTGFPMTIFAPGLAQRRIFTMSASATATQPPV